ncbi:MAG: riboflavin biosynthesis protein [Planctomycetaceae bacterium]|nr:MAG: riboflavin biosynthesis protein [Planctomycetaceae bacterium]
MPNDRRASWDGDSQGGARPLTKPQAEGTARPSEPLRAQAESRDLVGSLPAEACGGSITIGNFDGVHRGHQAILQRLAQGARERGHAAVAVTFDRHPRALLQPHAAPSPLSTLAQRVAWLQMAGAQQVVVLPVTPHLLSLTAAEFFSQVVVERLQARRVVEGPNFCFGKQREGTLEVLARLCETAGIELEIVPAVQGNEEWISSSRIRQMIQAGEVETAQAWLGHVYFLSGIVGRGAGRGRLHGFPTANLEQLATLCPAQGVYGGRAVVDGAVYRAAIHIGPNLTFDEHKPKVEVHLLDFVGDLYGRELSVSVERRLRALRRFDSPAELQQQLVYDIARVRDELPLADPRQWCPQELDDAACGSARTCCNKA